MEDQDAVYPSKSALRNYYIESSLPEFIINKKYNVKPLPKTHQFYKNDVFIWNNPYRSSKKNYKYFHQQQQQYIPISESIRQKALQDHQHRKQQQIKLFRALRDQDRIRIKTRKEQREKLQSEAYGLSLKTVQSSKSSLAVGKKTEKSEMRKQRRSTCSEIDLAAQKIIQSTILKQRQDRLMQLRNRKTQIEQLVKKSGQTMKMRRPLTGIRRSHSKIGV